MKSRLITLFVLITLIFPIGAIATGARAAGTGVEIPVVSIPEIQGAGHLSPYRGQTVTTEGVVTGVAFDGFFVQDPVGDGNADTSDGMWVFMGNFCNGCPAVGDHVQLTDRVDEFIPGGAGTGNLSTTDMAFPNLTALSSGNPLPAPVVIGRSGRIAPNVVTISEDELPVNLQDDPGVFNPDEDGIDFYESLEGMLVTVEDAVAVSAVRAFGNFSSELFVLPNNGHPQVIQCDCSESAADEFLGNELLYYPKIFLRVDPASCLRMFYLANTDELDDLIERSDSLILCDLE